MSDSVIITSIGFVFLLALALIFKENISQARKVKFGLTGFEFEASEEQFKALFKQTYGNLLKRNHLEFFIKLFELESDPMVQEVIPGFNRESEEWCKSEEGKKAIGMLRALRGVGFITPESGGKWNPQSKIVITDFGREFKTHIK